MQFWSQFDLYGDMPAALSYGSEPTNDPFVRRALTSSRDGRIRRDDVIDWRLASAGDRWRSQTRWVAGTGYTIPVVRGGNVVRVPFVAERLRLTRPVVVALWFGLIGNLWILAFALLMSLRATQNSAARLLVLILLSELSWIGEPGTWLTPWVVVDAVMTAASSLVYGASFVLIAVYASTVERPLTPLRRGLLTSAWISASISTILNGAEALLPFGTAFDAASLSPALVSLQYALPVVAAFSALGGGLVTARGLERARLIWATASLGMLFIPLTLGAIVSLFVPSFGQAAGAVADVAGILAPLGLSYVLLNRRLLDVGFSLNRAAVFAVLSLVVFGTFDLAEWALGGWLGSLNHAADAGLSAALALGLGLSLKPMHDRVERVVDRVFFRRRYEAERALLALTQQAPHFSDPAALIRTLESVLIERTDASSVVVLRDDGGRLGDLDPDDGALVALRTSSAFVDLHSLRTALAGEYAFPMVVRGRLTGVLVIGSKPYREPYAPDELQAVDRLARAVGIALDGLDRAANEDGRPSYAVVTAMNAMLMKIAGELHALRASIASLQSAERPESNGVQSRGVAIDADART